MFGHPMMVRWPVLTLLVLAACTDGAGSAVPATSPAASLPGYRLPSTANQPPASPPEVALPPTHPNAFSTFPGTDGARYATGSGGLPMATPIDVDLAGVPLWVVGVPLSEDVAWWVALDSGSIVEVVVTDGVVSGPVAVGELAAGAPPAVAAIDVDDLSLVHRPQTWGSPLSHPIGVGDIGVVIEADGRLRVEGPGGVVHHDLDVPSDARLLHDGSDVLMVTGATTRYPHAALGDTVEGSSVTLLDLETGEPSVLFELPDPSVIEGTTPMWVDLDGDGAREIVVTKSDPAVGARLAIFDMAGNEVGAGPAIGQGNRWRHQVAVAPFGPGAELEVAAVLTPPIGGEVQFYRWAGDSLEIVARVPGFSSHRFLSHNLDMALAADADGDGRVELVVPTDDYRTLGGIRRTADGAEVAWTVPIGGLMSTNLGVIERDGELTFAAGTEDGVLRVWP